MTDRMGFGHIFVEGTQFMGRMNVTLSAALASASLVGFCATAQAQATPQTESTPQTQAYRVNSDDARRFVEVFNATHGAPTEEDLQAGYLDGAGRGVEIFTPNRIVSAKNLAGRIADNPDAYQRAIDVCLPIAEDSNEELNQIYSRLATLLPGQALPDIHVVFGGGNSGGTAGPGAQVLGLEVICAVNTTEEEIRASFRMFFAHETVHTMQDFSTIDWSRDPLLAGVIMEGLADYVAWRATDAAPSAERDSWAREREAWLWQEFQQDREIVQAAVANGSDLNNRSPEMQAAILRWLQNYQNAPEGWPHEAGYWVGRQIVTAYVEQHGNEVEALAELMNFNDPYAVLEASGYNPVDAVE
ncbi:DUF2268 domain-containing putative Zn-dependent protease [Maricaulis sp. D1M11]|uniref:gliding motility protein GldB-related protein n=1 Tax=Maricaulis sp. D1M11 TaxID=3076117 RepID=UPI0039B68528